MAYAYKNKQIPSLDVQAQPVLTWVAPIIGYYKLNVDASFKFVECKAWVDIVL